MKIAITGHSRGIGHSLAANLGQQHDIIGFSRSNGYDISQPIDRSRIIAAVDDIDIFINNANCGFHQAELLFELFTNWHARRKSAMILSLGSRAGIRASVNSILHHHPSLYSFQKLTIQEMSRTLSIIAPVSVKVACVLFGFVDTERMRTLHPERTSFIPLAHVNHVVDWVINQPTAVFVAELAIYDYPNIF